MVRRVTTRRMLIAIRTVMAVVVLGQMIRPAARRRQGAFLARQGVPLGAVADLGQGRHTGRDREQFAPDRAGRQSTRAALR
jgi:hypothetical protein